MFINWDIAIFHWWAKCFKTNHLEFKMSHFECKMDNFSNFKSIASLKQPWY